MVEPVPGKAEGTNDSDSDAAVPTPTNSQLIDLENIFFKAWAEVPDNGKEKTLADIFKGHADGYSAKKSWRDNKDLSEQDKEKLFYAVAKFVTYRSQLNPKIDNKVWQNSSFRTQIKKEINKALDSKGADSRLSEADKQWLAWMACDVFSDKRRGSDQARVVRIDTENDPADHDVNFGFSCSSIDPVQVQAAIKAAIESLETKTQ